MKKQTVFIVLLADLIKSIFGVPGIVQTVAGGGESHTGKKSECIDKPQSVDGIGEAARFSYPWGIVHDSRNNALYVADCACPDSPHPNDRIRKINLKTNEVTTIAGSTSGFANGYGEAAHFTHVAGMALDSDLDMLYVADSGNHRIRVVYLANRKVDTIAGSAAAGYADLALVSSMFNNPQGVAVYRTLSGSRKLYVADTDNHAIRVINLENDQSGRVSTVAGGTIGFQDGEGRQAKFNRPVDMVIDQVNGVMYISEWKNHAIRRLDLTTNVVSTLAGKGFGSMHNLEGVPEHVSFFQPEGLVFDPEYKVLYVVEFGAHQIKVVTLDGLVKTLAGEYKGFRNGVGKVAKFYHPTGLAFDSRNKMLYVSDQYNHLIRSVSAVGSKLVFSDVLASQHKELANKQAAVRDLAPLHRFNYSVTLMFFVCLALMLFGAFFVKPLFKMAFNRFANGNSGSKYYYAVKL